MLRPTRCVFFAQLGLYSIPIIDIIMILPHRVKKGVVGGRELMTIQEITQRVEKESIDLRQITAEVAKVVLGQRNLVDRMLIGLLKEQYAIRILYDKQKVV